MTTVTIADASYWLFTIFNVLRIVSYLPQIYRVATDLYRRVGDRILDVEFVGGSECLHRTLCGLQRFRSASGGHQSVECVVLPSRHSADHLQAQGISAQPGVYTCDGDFTCDGIR